MELEDEEAPQPEMLLPLGGSGFAPATHEAAKLRLLAGGGGGGGGGGGNGNGLSGASYGAGAENEVMRVAMEVSRVSKKPVKYRECLKNHVASLGGHATDGCGEFMPSGEEGTLEALKCAACDCHRNFHRREMEGEASCGDCQQQLLARSRDGKKRFGPLLPTPHAPPLALPPANILPRPTSQMIMAFRSELSDHQEHEGALATPPMSASGLRKRFRTKFSAEQKEKMHEFAEKLGWRIQKHDEQAVQEFCAEFGVKRHVLKVWMHNNKHSIGKKTL